MDYKAGVKWKDMHVSMWDARRVVDDVYRDHVGHGVTLTSARRSGTGLHAKGRAIDVRIWGMSQAQVRRVASDIRDRLGPDFDVVIEGPAAEDHRYLHNPPHIHIEYEGD